MKHGGEVCYYYDVSSSTEPERDIRLRIRGRMGFFGAVERFWVDTHSGGIRTVTGTLLLCCGSFFYTAFYFVSNSCSSSNTIVRSSFESCNNVMLYPETVPFSTISSNMRIAFLIESNESCNICMR